MKSCCKRVLLLKAIIILSLSLVLTACGGGGGGGANGGSISAPPIIGVEVDGVSNGYATAIGYVLDASTGGSIGNATVTINGVMLTYNSTQRRYVGTLTVSPGADVRLKVSVNNGTYAVTGRQFTSFPSISSPTSGAQWQKAVANTIAWSAGTPMDGAFYGVGVYNTDSGYLSWPVNGTSTLQKVATGINSYTIPAGEVPVGNSAVIVAMSTSSSIPGAAAGSIFAICGFSSLPITVADWSGTDWTPRQADWSTDDFRAVAWSGSLFVTVGGDSGHILTSRDGATWARQTPASGPLYGVAWGGNQFVAVGSNGKIIISADGVSWTVRSSGTTASLSDVVWTGDRFLAIGNGYSDSTGNSNVILTSADGVSWTVTDPGTKTFLHQVTWSGSQLVAVGGTSGSGSPDTCSILTSTDGVTWTPRNSGVSSKLLGVTWSGTQFVIVGVGGNILTSPDGITWTQRSSGTTVPLYNVAWSGKNFVAVGYNRTILTSSDGMTWTPVTANYIYSDSLYDVIWAGNKFVAVGESGSIYTSP